MTWLHLAKGHRMVSIGLLPAQHPQALRLLCRLDVMMRQVFETCLLSLGDLEACNVRWVSGSGKRAKVLFQVSAGHTLWCQVPGKQSEDMVAAKLCK